MLIKSITSYQSTIKRNLMRKVDSLILQILLTRVTNTIIIDSEKAITLWKTRAIVNLANSSLTAALLQTESSGTGVSDDITTNGFLWIRIKHGTGPTIDLGNDLVRDHDCNAKFICKPLQGTHELSQMGLP